MADKDIKIHRYTAGGKDKYALLEVPKDVDFQKGLKDRNLYKEKEVHRGDHGNYRARNYYSTVDLSSGLPVYSDLIVQRAYTYSEDHPNSTAVKTETIKWYCEDDTTSPDTKVMNQIFSGVDYMDFMEQKRKFIVATLKGWVLPAMFYTMHQGTSWGLTQDQIRVKAHEFFVHFGAQESAYLKAYSTAFSDAVAADATAGFEWLDEIVPDGIVPSGVTGEKIRDLISFELAYM